MQGQKTFSESTAEIQIPKTCKKFNSEINSHDNQKNVKISLWERNLKLKITRTIEQNPENICQIA